jgi:lysozyme
MIKGIDISHHQNDKGALDLKKAKDAGYEFCFIKATQGTGYLDPFFIKNRNDARAAGMLVGFYHFAGNFQSDGSSIPADPVKEADWFLKNVGTLQKNDILILDWEVNHADPETWCRTFLDRVKEKTSLNGLFYTYEARLKASSFKKVLAGDYGLWIAKYGDNDEIPEPNEEPNVAPWTAFAVWQYSSQAKVSGLPGNIDVNLCRMTIETLKKYGYQGNDNPVTPSPMYYSQKDPRWANEKLGTCNDTIGKSGCKVACLASFAGITPSEANKRIPYQSGCLTEDVSAAKALGLEFNGRVTVKPSYECIAETDHYKPNGVPQHFFILLADGTIADPLDLDPKPKKNPYKIVSYRLFKRKIISNPEPPMEGKCKVEPELRDALKECHGLDFGEYIDPQDQRLLAERDIALKKSEMASREKLAKIEAIIKS